ncbi:30S ribosomal protein S9 [Patescibacteria group bacterium]|nr:30S ribosomal protein S9 [Patescibacteria group bacterium]MBU1970270.1 30S ribosomal protein S9 [Patescibacteria group bacterium]
MVYRAVGRRKTAVASIFLQAGKGKFTVNDQPIQEYFSAEKDKVQWLKPFFAVGISAPEQAYSGTIKVSGSGKTGQLGAVTLAISRALVMAIPEAKPALRKQGLLTRDSRMVERKKPYLRKARKAPQYSKR